MGNFNEILFSYEKEGGQPRGQICMDHFREALEDYGLYDMGFSRDLFTWKNNNHNNDQYIRERLDKAVAIVDWRIRFPNFRVINGEPCHSDHRPVTVVTEDNARIRSSPGPTAFRFEAGWAHEENCASIVENVWNLTMQSPSW